MSIEFGAALSLTGLEKEAQGAEFKRQGIANRAKGYCDILDGIPRNDDGTLPKGKALRAALEAVFGTPEGPNGTLDAGWLNVSETPTRTK
ncbi:hypothetical protein [Tateyamaria sp.]|uniref:hypothetical protein n=1 Tax=Tateyamaria sp. TaxID=1929288 RepID=UPI00329AB35C